jgi:hypothetical protein
MGSGSNPSTKADLFSAQQPPDTSSLSASEPKSSPLRTDEPAAASSPSYALPTNLPSALRHLDDDQLDRLLAAVLAERQARGGKKLPVSDETPRKQRTKEVAPPLASWEVERCSRRLQSWCHNVTDCSTVRDFPVRCEKGIGERSIEVSTQP